MINHSANLRRSHKIRLRESSNGQCAYSERLKLERPAKEATLLLKQQAGRANDRSVGHPSRRGFTDHLAWGCPLGSPARSRWSERSGNLFYDCISHCQTLDPIEPQSCSPETTTILSESTILQQISQNIWQLLSHTRAANRLKKPATLVRTEFLTPGHQVSSGKHSGSLNS